jgi:hypothetical protein
VAERGAGRMAQCAASPDARKKKLAEKEGGVTRDSFSIFFGGRATRGWNSDNFVAHWLFVKIFTFA